MDNELSKMCLTLFNNNINFAAINDSDSDNVIYSIFITYPTETISNINIFDGIIKDVKFSRINDPKGLHVEISTSVKFSLYDEDFEKLKKRESCEIPVLSTYEITTGEQVWLNNMYAYLLKNFVIFPSNIKIKIEKGHPCINFGISYIFLEQLKKLNEMEGVKNIEINTNSDNKDYVNIKISCSLKKRLREDPKSN
jgi:hypothetical protein